MGCQVKKDIVIRHNRRFRILIDLTHRLPQHVFVDENQQSVVCIDSDGAYSAVSIRADASGQPQVQPTLTNGVTDNHRSQPIPPRPSLPFCVTLQSIARP